MTENMMLDCHGAIDVKFGKDVEFKNKEHKQRLLIFKAQLSSQGMLSWRAKLGI